MPTHPLKHSVLGTGVSATSYREILKLTRDWIEAKRLREARETHPPDSFPARWVAVLTVNAIMTAVFDREYQDLLNASDISTPDGKPLAWALRSFGVSRQPRVYGPNLTLHLCEQAARLGHRVFMFGGRPETVPEACRKLCRKYEGLIIAGTYPHRDPPATQEKDEACVEAIRQSGADIVFVGFGQPRQERWMATHASRLPGVLMVGIGAAIDFHAGRVKQAPVWMQEAGLEWLFRLLMEPRRLWRRYLIWNPIFLAMWALQVVHVLRYPSFAGAPERRHAG